MGGGRREKPSRTSGFLARWVDDGHKCSAPILRVGDCSPPPSLGSLRDIWTSRLLCDLYWFPAPTGTEGRD